MKRTIAIVIFAAAGGLACDAPSLPSGTDDAVGALASDQAAPPAPTQSGAANAGAPPPQAAALPVHESPFPAGSADAAAGKAAAPEDGLVAVAVPHGDCVHVACPSSAPFPAGCAVTFTGGDPRACIAYNGVDTDVFLKDGNDCSQGGVQGVIYCSPHPGGVLDATTCPLNKRPLYVSRQGDCPK